MSTKKNLYPELPRKHLGPGWWLANRHYTVYMLRELTSFFVTVFSFIYIYQIFLLATNPASYNQYLNVVRNPAMILFSAVALGFTLFHSLTWFNLMGKIQLIKVGRKPLSPMIVTGIFTVLLVVILVGVIQLFLVGK